MKRPSPDSADHGPAAAVATAAGPLNPRAAIAMQGGKLGLFSLTCVIYLVVSGGAYGTEDAVRMAGPRLTLLLCLLVPLTLSLPTALMAAELNALMPVEGGFYFWVKEALGPFWGFAEAYLTLLYTAVDMAIYPVLFSAYLAFLYPLGTGVQLMVGVALVWLAGLLNFFGVRPAGDSAILLTVLLLAPFAALVVFGFGHLLHWHAPGGRIFGSDFALALGGGLTIIIWNFSGWENASVVAGEIREPRRTYQHALAIALPMVVLGYLLPLGVALSGTQSGAKWETGWYSEIGRQIGGPALGAALAMGGMVSAFSIFAAALLWVSRMPFVLARESYLPRWLAEVWRTTATPGKSILACCVLFTMLVPLGFVTLVILDVFFYMGALVLELSALVVMRRKRPARDGLFMIGGGRAGLYLVAGLPMLTWCATFGLALTQGGIKEDFVIAVVLAATTYPAYALCRRLWGGPPRDRSVFDALVSSAHRR
ncbi:MAG TPA: APC family permease [Candidatus Binataceae bacterium]|nr:APC family permease [Candidatus Binataceae bacterium]